MMRIQNYHFVVVLCLLLTSVGTYSAQAEPKRANLVTIETGDLPIILSAPHGGRVSIPGVPERQGDGVRMFQAKSDFATDQLASQLADAIEKKLGKRPYVVIARFHRKYLDANRRDRDAYESQEAKSTYDVYHQALATARAEVIERWGHGILLDIHGQSAKPNAIIRGTQNGKTTTHLVRRFGVESLLGESSLFGQLAKQGFPVIPVVGSTDREHPNYNGGYIVATYGSGSGSTLDAIQLELGRELRSPDVTAKTAAKLANAIIAYAGMYLPKTERSKRNPSGKQRPDKVNVGVYIDKGAGRSLQDLLTVLRQDDDVSVRELLAEEIRGEGLEDLDVLIHPGGSGSVQGRELNEDGRKKVRQFIEEGGGFIGICAGAYLASADYEWSLNVLDAKVLDRKHWARGTGMVEIGLTDTGRRTLQSKKQQLTIYYGQGPLLAPGNKADIPDYEIIATYQTEIAANGAPQGVMKGTTAMAQGEYGRGRVFCFSPHPEKTKGLESLVHEAIEHVKRNRSSEKLSPLDRQPATIK